MSGVAISGAERDLLRRILRHAAAVLGDELTAAVADGAPAAIDAIAARAQRLGAQVRAVDDGVAELDAPLLVQLRAWRAGLLELLGGERRALAGHLDELAACDRLLERVAGEDRSARRGDSSDAAAHRDAAGRARLRAVDA